MSSESTNNNQNNSSDSKKKFNGPRFHTKPVTMGYLGELQQALTRLTVQQRMDVLNEVKHIGSVNIHEFKDQQRNQNEKNGGGEKKKMSFKKKPENKGETEAVVEPKVEEKE